MLESVEKSNFSSVKLTKVTPATLRIKVRKFKVTEGEYALLEVTARELYCVDRANFFKILAKRTAICVGEKNIIFNAIRGRKAMLRNKVRSVIPGYVLR
jgi:hypothetical protein